MKKTLILSAILAVSASTVYAGRDLDSPIASAQLKVSTVTQGLVVMGENRPSRIANEYIVMFKDDTEDEQMVGLANDINADRGENVAALRQFAKLKGFAGVLNQNQLTQLQNDPRVKSIEANQVIETSFTSVAGGVDSWALDRIDQGHLPLDNVYAPDGHGNGVHAYVLDTGIYTEHHDFAGRASWDFTAANISDGNGDDNGHGTHLAGLIGSNTWGVAREVNLHAVKVLDGSGSGTLAGLIEGIEYVTANHQPPAVATIGFKTHFSQSLNDAVAASIAAGVVYAVPAGDDNRIACDYSPGSTNDAISVSSTDQFDNMSGSANTGACVDLFAPGLYVKSTWHTGPYVNNTISHSPTSAALVAGAAAIMRGYDHSCTPAQVKTKLLNKAKSNVLAGVPDGTNNLYLSVEYSELGGCEGDDPSTDGSLIAMYPFNHNANDHSGNGYHGSVSGAQMTTDRFGRANSAYFFNGNDRISVAGLSGYNWGANFTASVWFKRTGNFGNYQGVLSNGYYSNGSWEMRMGRESSGQRLVYLVHGPSQGGETSTAYAHQWHHAVLTFDGTRVKGYMDTNVVVDFPRTTPTPIRHNPLFIGQPGTGSGGEYFYGVIDDIRLYDRALSAEEIAELFASQQGDSALVAQ